MAVDLYWLPLGAGGHSVRLNGIVFEAIAARIQHRPACDLYHSALELQTSRGRFVVEQAPAGSAPGSLRGVVGEGSVGASWAGRLRVFRYEVRCWPGGLIPDLAEAVDSPRLLSTDRACADRIVELGASVPTPTWGRDELHAGEMWNSNSIVSWLLTRAGIDVAAIAPPAGGRAPGWRAGVTVARRDADRLLRRVQTET